MCQEQLVGHKVNQNTILLFWKKKKKDCNKGNIGNGQGRKDKQITDRKTLKEKSSDEKGEERGGIRGIRAEQIGRNVQMRRGEENKKNFSKN